MAADDDSNYSSNDENDPSFIAMQAQQRLFQLKRDRDERLGALVEDSTTAMEELRSRVVAYQKERRSKQADVCAASVMKIVEAVERRKEIEQQMEALVSKVNSKTKEVEDMMKAGFRGREKDMKQAR
ncbi:hypothetical protein CEP54_003606 [Fusarium duplospermum]|uniref:Uncharacterized protein n=1 Tax=Fusarium duplospermum TaxID=1325734 RepID=A0A428QNB9_9HYPO|nr:hypothetical protein CEP54_003606 [Fusarium duplospermum]